MKCGTTIDTLEIKDTYVQVSVCQEGRKATCDSALLLINGRLGVHPNDMLSVNRLSFHGT